MPFVFGSDGLDIVFVIDESGSMWGSSKHPQPNDKHRHRAGIVENVIIRFAEHAKGTPLVYRVSVVEFGGDKGSASARVLISNLQLKYNPIKPDEIILKTRMRVAASLYKRTGNMGNTNTPLAMKTALAEFRKLEAANGGVARERKLLIITDGRPFIFNSNLINLRTDIKNYAKDFKKAKVELWLVGLNDASNYWNSGDGQFWEEVAGIDKARLAETSFPHIPAVVQDIADQWLGLNSVSLSNDEYHSRPYLKRITFNVHSRKPGAKSELIDPNALQIQPTNSTSKGTHTRYIVENPVVGTYKINKLSSSGYKVFVEENAPSLTYIAPHGVINQNVNNRIVFKVMQGYDGLQELPQWPVNAQVIVTPPSGMVQTLPATFDGDGKYSAAWMPTEVGKHQFTFQAKVEVTTDKGLKLYDLVDSSSVGGHIEVQAYTPPPDGSLLTKSLLPDNVVSLHLETPNHEDGLSLSSWEDTATVKFSLYQGEEQVMTLEDVVTNPETWLQLELMDKSGMPLSEQAIPLKVVDNYFVAEIPIKQENWWSLSVDKLHLRVTTESNQLTENRQLYGIWLPESLEDKRIYGNPRTVADIDIIMSFWLMILVGFIILLLVLVLIVLLLQRLAPRLNIRGEDRGRIVNLLIYDGIEDPSAIYPTKKLNITGQVHSKLDQQIRVNAEGKTLVAEYFRVSRSPNPNSPQVNIQYRWQGEKKDTVHKTVLSGKIPKRVEGLPYGNYMIALGY